MANQWDETADVVVVGSGCAGTVAAITAKEEGANVLIVERQPKETHCTSSAMAGGSMLLPQGEKTAKHLESLYQIPAGLSWVEKDIIQVYVKYGQRVKEWVDKHGGQLRPSGGLGEHPEVAGHDAFTQYRYAGMGFGLQRFLDKTVEETRIPVTYNTRAKKLITDPKGRVIGIEAETDSGKTVKIGASKGVVLACGGFEFNETMKLNYLPVHPTYFTGHPSATGDGIRMCLAIGSDLWHMNCVSARLVAKFPDCPMSFSVSLDSMRIRGTPGAAAEPGKRPGYVIVDRDGKRFTNEDFKIHAVYYEVTYFDTHRMAYPRVPCFWIMDQRRIEIDSLVTLRSGAAGPCGLYEWSKDNSKGLEKGWIVSAGSIGELALKLYVPPANLEDTIKAYNQYCAKGKDPEFGRSAESLVPMEPPFYALRLWPGGPNTQGGPKRNGRCQILNVDGDPIPGLYSVGELAAQFGLLYPGGGSNLAECMAMSLVAAENVAHERAK